MSDIGESLMQRKNLYIPARIPHQLAARSSRADSFPPGEAIVAMTIAQSLPLGKGAFAPAAG